MPTVTILAGTSIDVIENNTEGVLDNFLQDGGKAIMSAVKQVVEERLRKYTVCDARIYANVRICACANITHSLSLLLIREGDHTKTPPRPIGVRRCHAHVARFGGTRGGVKRGGKGSLPRYLLDNKVPQKLMAEMMSKLLMFNFIRGRDVFKHAMVLFIEEYTPYIIEYICPCELPRSM